MKKIWTLTFLIIYFLLLNFGMLLPFFDNYQNNRFLRMLEKGSESLLNTQTANGGFVPSEMVRPLNTYVFVHSYIFDALLDARAASVEIDSDVISKAQDYLLKMRYADCWNFTFNIPCDTDDSALAVLALLRSDIQIDEIQKSIIQLNSSITPEGYSKLWITANDTVYMYFVENNSYAVYYGNVYDSVYLTAGTIYCFYLFNYSLFTNLINRGISILENSQESNGAWLCKYWYPGEYYGTFLSTRLIACLKPNSSSLLRTYNFLIGTQKSDGGWGRNTSSNPLDTSLALLSLNYLSKAGFDCKTAVLRGFNYLFYEQFENGTFREIPLWTAAPDSYCQGKTLTTAFAVKALAYYINDQADSIYLNFICERLFILNVLSVFIIGFGYFLVQNDLIQIKKPRRSLRQLRISE